VKFDLKSNPNMVEPASNHIAEQSGILCKIFFIINTY
jgi:hypothetical protein